MFKILYRIDGLFKDYRPMALFGWVGLVLLVIGTAFGIPVVGEYASTGLVPRLPTFIASCVFIGIGLLSFVCGLILDTTVKGHRKDYELAVIEAYRRYN